MIQKPLEQISPGDLDALITNSVRERKTIDYKRELPGGKDADKKEFLADVSSFANTLGGDLVFGLEEAGGVPTKVTGVSAVDADGETRRLDSIIASGIDPRIRYAIRMVEYAPDKAVFIIRVERSWVSPHRVIFGGHDKFYARNSAGKYPLDVTELREAFLNTATLPDRIRRFRSDRVQAVSIGLTPLPVAGEGKVVLHLVPVEAFTTPKEIDVLEFFRHPEKLQPLGASGWDRRINLEGVCTFAGQSGGVSGYTQVYRNGTIEAVEGRLLNREHNGRRTIPSISFEKELLQGVTRYLAVQRSMGIDAPIYLFISLVGVKGCWMAASNAFFDVGEYYPVTEENLLLPEVLVDRLDQPAEEILRPAFDMVWNACGYPSSGNFDNTGRWNPK